MPDIRALQQLPASPDLSVSRDASEIDLFARQQFPASPDLSCYPTWIRLGPPIASVGGGISATIAANDGADTHSITAAIWATAQIVATDGADAQAIVAEVTTGAQIAGTDGADVQSLTVDAGQPPVDAGGWRGHGGEWEDEPWWVAVPVKPIPRKVERAIEAAAKVAPAESRALLAQKLERAGVEWDDQYNAVLSAMLEREAATVAALRRQVNDAIDSLERHEFRTALRGELIVRENEELLLLLLN